MNKLVSRTITLATLGLFGLTASAACTSAVPDGDEDVPSACASDSDCKGDRVCDDGACVSPSGEPVNGGTGTGSDTGTDTGTPPADQCIATGDSCAVNGDCCNFNAGNGYCVSNTCSDSCDISDGCVSGCCLPLTNGAASCFAASECSSCGSIDYTGYCDGDKLVFCDGGIKFINCAAYGKSCGWNDDVGYDCV